MCRWLMHRLKHRNTDGPVMPLCRVGWKSARVGGMMLAGLAMAPWCAAELDRMQLIGLAGTVLKIEADRSQGGYSLGSGVAIAPDRIVTNCHVTHDAQQLHVLRGGARWPAKAQLRDAEHDLCMLWVPRLEATVAALADTDRLVPGQAVSALGYTGGLNMQYSAGEVVALHRLDGGRVIQSTNWFNSGASGGGLFDEGLRLVGILTFRLRGGAAHYYAAPTAWLRALVDAPTASYEPIAPDRSDRLPYWQRAVAEQPRFLRAGSMERDQRWAELQTLAGAWVRDDASDPEPWYLLGASRLHLDQVPQARAALRCAAALQPQGHAVQALSALDAEPPPDQTAAPAMLTPSQTAVLLPDCPVANQKEFVR